MCSLLLFLGVCLAKNKVVVDLTGGLTNTPNSTVTVGAKDSLEVILPGNPTTGFMWQLVNSTLNTSDGEPALTLKKIKTSTPKPDPNGLVVAGAGLQYSYIFKPIVAKNKVKGGTAVQKSVTVQLVYAKPWEIEKCFTNGAFESSVADTDGI